MKEMAKYRERPQNIMAEGTAERCSAADLLPPNGVRRYVFLNILRGFENGAVVKLSGYSF